MPTSRGQRGVFHIGLGLLIMAIIGGWFLWRSYSAGTLKDDLQTMVGDLKSTVTELSQKK